MARPPEGVTLHPDHLPELEKGYKESSSGNLLVPGHAASGRPTRSVFYLPDGSRVEVDPDMPPIPPGLAHLDVWAGRAVPHIAWTTASGTIDLEDVDGDRFLSCIRERTCGMCALPLGYWLAWLMGDEDGGQPKDRQARLMREPAMHRGCARYAHQVWWHDRPWMLLARDYREVDNPNPKDRKRPILVRMPPAVTVERIAA
jgi:hypothetical protein